MRRIGKFVLSKKPSGRGFEMWRGVRNLLPCHMFRWLHGHSVVLQELSGNNDIVSVTMSKT
jgi:hypothetical protein